MIDMASGNPLDTIGVTDRQITYVTEAARPVVDAYAAAYTGAGLPLTWLVDELDGWSDGRVELRGSPIVLEAGWVPPVPSVLLNLAEAVSDRKLRRYWTRGEGAAKIGWGRHGDFATCVTHLGKYVHDPEGLCAEYHKAATGEWPGKNAHGGE